MSERAIFLGGEFFAEGTIYKSRWRVKVFHLAREGVKVPRLVGKGVKVSHLVREGVKYLVSRSLYFYRELFYGETKHFTVSVL